MNLPPNRQDELIDLFGNVRDERITEAEFQRLQQVLTEDAEARELYVQYMALHASLEQVGTADMLAQRLRETLHDEQVVRELQSMIAAERQSAFAASSARPTAGRYLALAVAAAALILVALFLGQLMLRGQSEAAWSAEIAAVYGRVESSGIHGETRITPGSLIPPGHSVTTGRNASVRLQYPDGSTVDLKAATELKLLKGARAKRLMLVTGSAYFDVSPQPAGAPLIVNPGQYDQVQVRGTSFQVNREKEGETRVLVASGSVLFGVDNAAVRIKARQGSVALRKGKPAEPATFDRAALWQGLARGLTATYYGNENLSGESVTRVDPIVEFDWGKSSPDPGIPADKFSARWTGRIEAEYTEPYTFYVRADEGARLWIDGSLVIDGWKNARGVKLPSAPIKLTAGRTYDVKLEYREAKDVAQIELLWSSPSTPRATVPHARLHPDR